MRVEWLRTALRNLDEQAEHIGRDDPRAACEVVAAILREVDGLRRFPAIGRPGRVAGTRELVIDNLPYIVPYRVKGDVIEVLRVFHTLRRPVGRW